MRNSYAVLASATAAAMCFAAVPAVAAEVTLSGASCFPVGSPPGRPFEAVVKAINAAGKGQVQVKLVGGAPAIGSPFTLTQKMSKGAYDLVGCTEAYFGNVLPEAPTFRLAERTYAALRKNGGIPYMQRLMAAKGIHYIGRHHDFGPFHLWLSKPISSTDLTGLHLRVSPVYTAFFKSMGATVQTSNIGQIYTYMENGTVQGYGWPALGWVPSWVKVTKYRVEPGFYNATLHTLANLKKWKTLTAAQKGVITKVVMKFEAGSEPDSAYLREGLKKQNAKTLSKGLKPITFQGANRKKWLDSASDAAWTEVRNRSPKHGAKLQKLFQK